MDGPGGERKSSASSGGRGAPAPRRSLRLGITLGAAALVATAGAAWYYHVPVAVYIPVDPSWDTLRKDWCGVMWSHTRYYRYRAPGSLAQVTEWVRGRLDEAGPWERRRDMSMDDIRAEIRDWHGEYYDRLGEEQISDQVKWRSLLRWGRRFALEDPGEFTVSRRFRHIEGRSAHRYVHVRASAAEPGATIVEIWDVDRFDF